MMPNGPSAEQIWEWTDMEFRRRAQSNQLYFNTGQPVNLQHEPWLKEQGKPGRNDQQESLGVGLPEPNVQTNESTELIPLEQEIGQIPLEAGHISSQPQHGRPPDMETRKPSRSCTYVKPPQGNIRPITMLSPTCHIYGLLATLNAKVDQSYISKAVICRMKLECHIKKTEFPKYVKTQVKRCVNRRSHRDTLE
ncbi:hypothetical protein DID88_007841 [Monilinia fructigena]|uniref:Uncharacterized protein n=1 Tax=Monilinia fructigena TaxID=38457 RepID=A0A395J3Y6_9HELO|nr:hypothetical protein DID88_007841 [Monilinia fructigena]